MAFILQKAIDLIPFSWRDRIRKIPGLKQVQAFLMKRMMNDKEFIATISGGPAKGLKMPVKMPGDKLMWVGTWELDFSKALASRIQKGMVCYDIGGYKAYYSGIMALNGASKVYVFEPMPKNISQIEVLIEQNKNLPIELIKAAVSDFNGKATFNLMEEDTMGKLDKSNFQRTDKPGVSIEVECVSLEQLIRQGLPEPDFIKIDVEGAEEFVIKGGRSILQKKKPTLMIEVHSPEIGKRCMTHLSEIYSNIIVLETGRHPEEGTPEICHYIAEK